MAEVSDAQADFYTSLLSQYRGRTIKKGDRSKSTRALQLFLRSKGYDIKADGVFGARTEKAVREWQKSEGLSADGQVGKRSLTKVREQITPRPKERPAAPAMTANMPPIGFEEEATLGSAPPPPLMGGAPPPTLPADSPMTPLDVGMPPMPSATKPPPSFEEEAVLPPGLGRGGPPPGLPPQAEPLPHHTPITMPDGTVLGGPPPPEMPAGLERGGPPPGMPPAVAGGGPGSFPGGSPVLPTGPLPEAPVEAPPPPVDVSSSPTVPSDLDPAQMSRMREMQGIGPYPPRPDFPAQDTGLARALAEGGAPDAQLNFPDTGQPLGNLMSSGEMSPQTLALIQALMARQQQQPVPGV